MYVNWKKKYWGVELGWSVHKYSPFGFKSISPIINELLYENKKYPQWIYNLHEIVHTYLLPYFLRSIHNFYSCIKNNILI